MGVSGTHHAKDADLAPRPPLLELAADDLGLDLRTCAAERVSARARTETPTAPLECRRRSSGTEGKRRRPREERTHHGELRVARAEGKDLAGVRVTGLVGRAARAALREEAHRARRRGHGRERLGRGGRDGRVVGREGRDHTCRPGVGRGGARCRRGGRVDVGERRRVIAGDRVGRAGARLGWVLEAELRVVPGARASLARAARSAESEPCSADERSRRAARPSSQSHEARSHLRRRRSAGKLPLRILSPKHVSTRSAQQRRGTSREAREG